MTYFRSFTALALLCLLGTGSCAATKNQPWRPDAALLATIDQNMEDAADQYKVLMANLPADKFPKTYFPTRDEYEFSGPGWWCSGFYPGTLIYLYEETGEEWLLAEARRILGVLEQEKNNTTTHDLGFMMYDSFGRLNALEPSQENKEILLTSAASLATRYAPAVGAIKSWDSKEGDYLVIIDNMMNLELLYWASKTSGDPRYAEIATTHANTTMAHHFRPDYSSYHVVNYNKETGAVQQKVTAQGFADESAWARGQSWGLYGYTATYGDTRDKRYLEQARKIAGFILGNPHLPADKVPYWDFDADNIPNALRDASAAAVLASALIELSGYVEPAEAKTYLTTAETILKTLSTDEYKAAPGTNGGFLLKRSVGHLPQNSEVDVPLTYADYYFVEAMHRYQQLAN